ncbi:MAG: alpha/beta fold hydrolase [Treponema sp.]|nr:alpha/beta fold hydrolase [Treponema sp.]
MDFYTYSAHKTYESNNKPTVLLIPGLGVSHEIFNPLIDALADNFSIITLDIDGFIIGKTSSFTTIDDQAEKIENFVQKKYAGKLPVAYGLSLGGKILSRVLERGKIIIEHAILDAAPLLSLPKWIINPLRYYQCFNVWTCYHVAWFWRLLFHSHYFDVLLAEIKKCILLEKAGQFVTAIKKFIRMS